MSLENFIKEQLTKENLQDLAEHIDLRRELGLEGIWEKYVNAEDILGVASQKKQKKVSRLSPEDLNEVAAKVMKGEIEIFAEVSGKEEKERRLAQQILDLVDEIFWEKISSSSKEELAALLTSLESFDVDDLKPFFDSGKMKEVSEKLQINYSDLNLETDHDQGVLWDRIVGIVQPDALGFEEAFKEGRTSRQRYLRWWHEQQRKVEALHQEATPNYANWQQEQADYHKLLKSGRSREELDYSDISYLFQWISNLTKGLQFLSERLAKLEGRAGSTEEDSQRGLAKDRKEEE